MTPASWLLESVTATSAAVSAAVAYMVYRQLRTGNGIPVGELAERQEGRRILRDIPKVDRSSSEQGYVDNLRAGGRNLGHTGPEDVLILPSTDPDKPTVSQQRPTTD